MPIKGLLTISTGENRAEWLESRKMVITATQAAAIAGTHPYAKMIDVWNEKTDPNYDPEANRNKWLDERAELGVEREPEIIEWASNEPRMGGPKAPFKPNRELVALPENPMHAATPDAYKIIDRSKLVLLECKTTQQNWELTGLPAHIYDQAQWQIHATGAVSVWIAWERYEWSGRGKNRQAVKVAQGFMPVLPDEARIAHLVSRVAQFETWLDEGIAPESDIDLRELAEPNFDATPDEVEEYAELIELRDNLDRIAELQAEVADKLASIDALKAQAKPVLAKYEGRRIRLIAPRMYVETIRFDKAKVDTSKLPADELRAITSWEETSRTTFTANPEFTPEP